MPETKKMFHAKNMPCKSMQKPIYRSVGEGTEMQQRMNAAT